MGERFAYVIQELNDVTLEKKECFQVLADSYTKQLIQWLQTAIESKNGDYESIKYISIADRVNTFLLNSVKEFSNHLPHTKMS